MKNAFTESDFKNLRNVIIGKHNTISSTSENHQTSITWLPWFESNLKDGVYFDKSKSSSKRPDLQIWPNSSERESNTFAPLWLEAKGYKKFKDRNFYRNATIEVLKKIKHELCRNRVHPPNLIIEDLNEVFYWDQNALRSSLKDIKNDLKGLNNPTGSFDLLNASSSEIQAFLRFINRSLSQYKQEPTSLDLPCLVTDLLGIVHQFQEQALPESYSYIESSGSAKKIYEVWKTHGGELTIVLLQNKARSANLGEETFAELCFHSLIVRMFAIKWCLDHGYLDGTQCQKQWIGLLNDVSVTEWEKTLMPSGRSEIEKLLRKVFQPTDMYLWILELIGSAIRLRLFEAFQNQKLLSSETDVLGDFYQSYLRVYSKDAQFELGQFYTPHKLVRTMWTLCKDVLRQRALSLSDDDVIVADPGAGTATFLTQGLRLAISGNWGEHRVKISGAKIAQYANKFTGLEINPFSKGVAEINYLTELLAHCNSVKSHLIPIPLVFETNTYEVDPVQMPLPDIKNESIRKWLDRWEQSRKAKKKGQYKIVIGNPPWRNPSMAVKNEHLKDILRNTIIPWGYEYQGEKLSALRGCNHGIREEYIYFYGIANRLIKEDGLICFVTNESWLMAPTYRLVRKYFLDNYRVLRILRLGPYFEGVKERACIAVMEKNPSAGRNQSIQYMDWSDLSNSEYSRDWINENLRRIIDGEIRDTEWNELTPQGEHCVLVPLKGLFLGLEHDLFRLEDLFKFIGQGAQSGYSPLFLDTDKGKLIRKIRKLFSGNDDGHRQLAEELGPKKRRGQLKARDLISRAYQKVRENNIKFSEQAVRPILAYFKATHSEAVSHEGYCYFDPRIWLFPRSDRLEPTEKNLWDTSLKLAFRDFSDPGKKVITAFIDDKGRVIDNHSINGGVQILFLDKDLQFLRKDKVDHVDLTNSDWAYYLYSLLNSEYSALWDKNNPRQRIRVPVAHIFRNNMRNIAKLGKKYHETIEAVRGKSDKDLYSAHYKVFNSKILKELEAMTSLEADRLRIAEKIKRIEEKAASKRKKRA